MFWLTLLNRLYKILKKQFQPLMLNKYKLERWFYKRLALDILMAAQGGTCAIIHTQCCTYIPDMSTRVTHFPKHTKMMIQAMDVPEASIASL